jgi:hypothetical protein
MKLISFDIGIKNMAYCIFDVIPNEQLNIVDWNILNLMDKPTIEIKKCNCTLEQKKKKKNTTNENNDKSLICNKKAKFHIGDKYFCEKHAKISNYLMPNKECSLTSLKKKKNEELISLCHTNFIYMNSTNILITALSKKNIIEILDNFFQNKMLRTIKEKKEKSASDVDLISIGRNMKDLLNNIPNIENITHVIIENQISPIANRMKTIQGMLSQYFIMKCSQNIHIEFVSSSNKLKGFNTERQEEVDDKDKYKQHKKDSIVICSQFIEKNNHIKHWISTMTSPKKDDLADSFLQGIWYLKNKNKISYTENFEINII